MESCLNKFFVAFPQLVVMSKKKNKKVCVCGGGDTEHSLEYCMQKSIIILWLQEVMVNLDHSSSVSSTEGHFYRIPGDEMLEENQFLSFAFGRKGLRKLDFTISIISWDAGHFLKIWVARHFLSL